MGSIFNKCVKVTKELYLLTQDAIKHLKLCNFVCMKVYSS